MKSGISEQFIKDNFVDDPINFLSKIESESHQDLLVVFSIGSGHESRQQVPAFAIEAAGSGKTVFVLNIDPCFSAGGIPVGENALRIQKYRKNLFVYYSPTVFPSRNDKILEEVYEKELEKILNKNILLVLIQHTYPRLSPVILNCAKKSKQIGRKLEVIGSYHLNQPCFVYNQYFFDEYFNMEYSKLLEFWNIWQYGCDLDSYCVKKGITTDQLARIFQALGTLYRNLWDIRFNELFKSKEPEIAEDAVKNSPLAIVKSQLTPFLSVEKAISIISEYLDDAVPQPSNEEVFEPQPMRNFLSQGVEGERSEVLPESATALRGPAAAPPSQLK